MNLRETAKKVLLHNYRATEEKYITPGWPHYKNQWLWDSCFHAIAACELGMEALAKNEIAQLFKYQKENGRIPHRIYHGFYAWFDIERFLYGTGIKPSGSSFVGQPVLAQAVESINDPDFWEKAAPKLVKFYQYFIKYRDALNITSVISPRETGRDAAPEFDYFRGGHLPRGFKWLDRILDPLFVYILDLRCRLRGWNEERILKEVLNIKDLTMHCIWIDGLYSLKRILEETGQMHLFKNIDDIIKRAEAALDEAWDETDKRYYTLRVKVRGTGDTGKVEKIKELGLGHLFTLLVKELPEEKKKFVVNTLKDPNHFWLNYPVPSVPASHSEFNVSRTFPLWRGPTWINANWFLIRGLMLHGYKDEASHIARKTEDMIKREGYREFYNPYTGKGMRVKNFSWSTLVVTFNKITNN